MQGRSLFHLEAAEEILNPSRLRERLPQEPDHPGIRNPVGRRDINGTKLRSGTPSCHLRILQGLQKRGPDKLHPTASAESEKSLARQSVFRNT